MERVNLSKYGFIRCPEEDFSDDGSRFICYKVGRVRVSKTTYNGDIFLAGRIDSHNLPYDVYSKLPHYSNMDRLNGVSISGLTDEDIKRFYDDCIAYQKEYEEAERNMKYPSFEELKEKANKIKELRQQEVNIIKENLHEIADKFILNASEYEYKNFRTYFKSLLGYLTRYDNDNYIKSMLNTASSISFMEGTSELKPNWYYENCLEILKKYE